MAWTGIGSLTFTFFLRCWNFFFFAVFEDLDGEMRLSRRGVCVCVCGGGIVQEGCHLIEKSIFGWFRMKSKTLLCFSLHTFSKTCQCLYEMSAVCSK